MKSSVEIRPAEAADAPAFEGLLQELGHPAPVEALVERMERARTVGEDLLVAVTGGRVIGYAGVHVTAVLDRAQPKGRITALVVTGSARGSGAGRRLIEAAEALVRERGCELLEVTSNVRLTDAHAFYEHLGFERTSFRFAKRL